MLTLIFRFYETKAFTFGEKTFSTKQVTSKYIDRISLLAKMEIFVLPVL